MKSGVLLILNRTYRLLLRLYPAWYRREYGSLMAQATRDLCWDTLHNKGYAQLLILWLHIMTDMLLTAAATHSDVQEEIVTTTFTVGQLTDTGLLRPFNEDSILSRFYPQSDQRIGLFVVADGLGGHQDGDKASKLAVEVISDVFEQNIMKQQTIQEALVGAVEAADEDIRQQLPNSGATVTAVVVEDRTAWIAHAGDTRAYLLHGSQIRQLTRDHSMVQRLVELGKLEPEEAINHELEHVIYRSLGQPEKVILDTYVYPLPRGSKLLLCSDGLWKLVDKTKIIEIATQNISPQEACGRLIALANFQGGEDNVTALLVNVD